jgi:hypothetical protein
MQFTLLPQSLPERSQTHLRQLAIHFMTLPGGKKLKNCFCFVDLCLDFPQYFRNTPITLPCIFTSAAATIIGAISEFAGCNRTFPDPSR